MVLRVEPQLPVLEVPNSTWGQEEKPTRALLSLEHIGTNMEVEFSTCLWRNTVFQGTLPSTPMLVLECLLPKKVHSARLAHLFEVKTPRLPRTGCTISVLSMGHPPKQLPHPFLRFGLGLHGSLAFVTTVPPALGSRIALDLASSK